MKAYSCKVKHDSEIHRTTRLARAKRDFIFEQLRRVCNNPKCPSKTETALPSFSGLEFDVVVPDLENPKGHHGKLSFGARMNFYLGELNKKNLQILCASCNGRKRDNYAPF